MPQVGGWLPEVENRAAILSRSLGTYAAWKSALTEYDWEAPKELDPRQWWQISNQGQMGSCQGNALADSAEICHLLQTGEVVQFSRNWAYYCSQKFDGLLGRDQGSTLNGGGKAASQIGFVLESDFPYTDNYRQGLSQFESRYDELIQKAALETMYGEVPLQSYDDIYLFLASLAGPVQIGVLWGVGNGWEIKQYRAGGGGHSVIFAGYLKVNGWPKPGLLEANSWGPQVGDRGWQLWHPDAVQAACRHQWNVFVGRSDMKSPVPRPAPDL
jgi:hypothetical protein